MPSIDATPIVPTRDTWRGRAILPVLVFIGLLASIVSSLGAPLVPTIGESYGVSVGSAQWSLTLTLLVGGVLAPVVGRLGDGPHRRTVLVVALGVFVVGSALAAVPAGFALLLAGRALQGVGMALLPLTLGVVRDHLEPHRTRPALATLSVVPVAGLGLGYPLTGVIADHLGFHTGFWLAAGLGVVAMVLAAVVVPSSSHRASRPFDLPGAVLLGVGVAGALICVAEGAAWGWGSLPWTTTLAVSAVLLLVWGRHELRTPAPLVDLRLMTNRTMTTANVCSVLAGIGMYALMSMVVRYIQTPTSVDYGHGATVVVAGLALVPMSIGSFVASRGASFAGRWIRPEVILPLGAVVFAGGCAFFALDRSELWQIFVVMGLVGLGTGFSFAVIPRMIVETVPGSETGSALAINLVVRNIGYSAGSALSATVLTSYTTAPSTLPADHGYTVGALLAAAMCTATALVATVLAVLGRKTRCSAESHAPRTAMPARPPALLAPARVRS